MIKLVLKNLFFYRQKTALTTALISFLFFVAFATCLFSNHIKKSADRPLSSLQTEVVLQQDKNDKNAGAIRTSGVIEPFNLQSFLKNDTVKKLSAFKEIKEISSALILWQFDIKNNKTIVGLDVNDPAVGLRKIDRWLMPQSKFFSKNNAQEIILERHFAKLFGYKLNAAYPINNKKYRIVGIVDFKEQSNLSSAQIFMPYNTALALLGQKTLIVNQVYISLSNASLLPKIQRKIENGFPRFSVITKDRLLKNLSSFNRLIYQFGNYFSFGVGFLTLLLIFWILKLSHLEFGRQTKILKTIGWPKHEIRLWLITESGFIVIVSLFSSLLFLAVFYWSVFPHIKTGVSLSQNFKL